MKSSWNNFFLRENERIRASQQHRRRRATAPSLCDFGSNDYLGLSKHREVAAAVKEALQHDGWGSGASPVVGGYSHWHRELEEQLAQVSGCEDAICFSSGFGCNAGVISSLVGPNDALLSDALNHASLIDGCRLSSIPRQSRIVFPHRDATFVANWLKTHRSEHDKVAILTESIFSMDGDMAPLVELSQLSSQYDCGLIVDEAHAVGVYGRCGGGLIEELGITSQVLLKLGTLSKALGSIGGYATGSRYTVDYLVNHCRSYLFSTSPPAAVAAAASAAVSLLPSYSDQRRKLRTTSMQLRERLRKLGWNIPLGDSPIIPVIVGDETTAMQLSENLLANGLVVPAIRPPTVPAGKSRLRISLSVDHTSQQIDLLLNTLGATCP